jgi:predicted transcriptional regulator
MSDSERNLEFSIAKMLAGEKSADEGRVRPLADVLAEIRAACDEKREPPVP